MARGLSLLLEIFQPAAPKTFAKLLAPTPGPVKAGPRILHYVWTVDMSARIPPKSGGIGTMLLTTVYDEDFVSYISDLVAANLAGFNALLPEIGQEKLNSLADPAHLNAFIEFVRKNDLNNGGDNPGFFQAYKQTVDQILAKFPQKPSAPGGAKSKPASPAS
jgi:hypothetical protein